MTPYLRPLPAIVLCTVLLLMSTATSMAQWSVPGDPDHSAVIPGFEENRGQVTDQYGQPRPDIQYSFVAETFRLRVLRAALSYELATVERPSPPHASSVSPRDPPHTGADPAAMVTIDRVDIRFDGASPIPILDPGAVTGGYANYYAAHLPESGATGVRTFTQVTMRDLYPGIDLVLHAGSSGSTHPVKYDFIVRPGADASSIRVRYDGTTGLRVRSDGTLEISTRGGSIVEQAPVCRAELPDGGMRDIRGAFIVEGTTVRFEIEPYPAEAVLVIDPGLVWSTYYGGSADDVFMDTGSDLGGSVYVCGYTQSTANIATTGSHRAVIAGLTDAMLVKFTASGRRIWATYAGGLGNDYGNTLAVHGSGVVFLAGTAYSNSGITTTGAWQTTHAGSGDGFVMRLDSSGTRVFGTYVGGNSEDAIHGIAINAPTLVFVAGQTQSTTGIASNGAHQPTYTGQTDGFLVRLSYDGATRGFGTYIGGSSEDVVRSIASDASGYAYIVGHTTSSTGIHTPNAHDTTRGGMGAYPDGFIQRFSSTGVRSWGTYYGGNQPDYLLDVTVDASNKIYAVGNTESSESIATPNAHRPNNTSQDLVGMVVCFLNTGVRQWGSYYAWGQTTVRGVTVSGSALYLCGNTNSTSGINSDAALQGGYAGSDDAFIARMTTDGFREYGSYYGGSGTDQLRAVTVVGGGSTSGDIVFVGTTTSDGLSTSTAHQTARGSGTDGLACAWRNVSISYMLTPAHGPYCQGTPMSADYTATGTFSATNVFRLELSDSNGSFTSPSLVGMRLSAGSGTINGTVPTLPPPGGGYYFRIASTNPRFYSGRTSPWTTLASSNATSLTWTGAVSGNWTTLGNWDNPCAIPTTGDTVVIPPTAVRSALSAPTITLSRVVVNHMAGLGLAGDMTITGQLVLQRGLISIGTNNVIITQTGSIVGGSDSSLILTGTTGELRQQGIGSGGRPSAEYPISIGGGMARVIIANSGTADEIRVRVGPEVTSNGLPSGTLLTSDIVERVWYLTEATPGGGNYSIEFQWKTIAEAPQFDRSSCFISTVNGGVWTPITGADSARSVPGGYWARSVANRTTLGTHAIGDLQSVIPVTLLSFTAAAVDREVRLEWRTADERGNAGFEVQRAAVDGGHWQVRAVVPSRAIDGGGARYAYVDVPERDGVWRYRLRQYDHDGTDAYSHIETVAVGVEPSALRVHVYPHPVRDAMTITADGPRTLLLRDALGRVVWRAEPMDAPGVRSLTVRPALPPGVYLLEAETARGTEHVLLRMIP